MTMKTPAIIASLTVVGSLAYAAGHGSTETRSPLVAGGPTAHALRDFSPKARIAQGDCPPPLTASWFAPTPRLIECVNYNTGVYLGVDKGNAVDINGDGRFEFWQTARSSVLAVWNGQAYSATEDGPASGFMLVTDVVERAGSTQVQNTTVPIFDQSIGEWCLANLPAPGGPNRSVRLLLYDHGSAYAWMGWRDMDGDGDLDFVCVATDDWAWGTQVWFENIGFENPAPPVAADLNGDGRVDGADLGMLLIAWGPNP